MKQKGVVLLIIPLIIAFVPVIERTAGVGNNELPKKHVPQQSQQQSQEQPKHGLDAEQLAKDLKEFDYMVKNSQKDNSSK